ncbi:Hypothetical predicted protein [Lecanosticta acicola]|uniref:BRCT domain-containing protein n=1 Tax=Lecanosticta acicola TaxID=111012 RepID=A0AAI9EDV3_9PEZI|nr:Hypothetical predicted protein [Lecanosticta acicola]
MVHTALKSCCITTLGHWKPEFSGENIKRWVAEASGKVTTTPTDSTTHAVITTKIWNQKGAELQEILRRKAQGQDIHIVDFPWLEDSLSKKAKLAEHKYCYEKRARDLAKGAEKQAEKDRRDMEKLNRATQPKTVSGMLAQEYLGHTEQYVDEKEKRRALEKARAEEISRKEREEEKRKAFEVQRDQAQFRAVAEVFKRGVKKARNELLSDNHHIYVDSTGFYYDVVLTRVNPYNKEETEVQELTLQIFESNNEPHTYAFNAKCTGTALIQNNVIAALGSTYSTAFRAFKKVFKEHTQFEWDNRFRAAEEREKAGRERRPKQGQRVEFKDMPFLYHPPTYGPLGEVPEKTLAQMAAEAIQKAWSEKKNQSGASKKYVRSGDIGARSVNSRNSSGDSEHDPAEDLQRLEEEVEAEALANALDAPFAAKQNASQSGPGASDELPEDTALGKRKGAPGEPNEDRSTDKRAKTATVEDLYPFEFGPDDGAQDDSTLFDFFDDPTPDYGLGEAFPSS